MSSANTLLGMALGRHDVSTGVADLDTNLGGLIPGDNIVWATDDESVVRLIEDALLAEGVRRGRQCVYVSTSDRPDKVAQRLPKGVVILDARSSGKDADAQQLEQTLFDGAYAS